MSSKVIKVIVKFLILFTLIELNTSNFRVKESLKVLLKLEKNVLNLCSIYQKINPCEFCKVINKTDIISITTNRNWSETPNIRMSNFK